MNSCKKILSINHKPKRLLKADKNISNISDDVSRNFFNLKKNELLFLRFSGRN